MIRVDFLVVGSGIAGLSFAIKVAKLGSVCVVTKKERAESATNLAQGGIAAVLGSGDSYESHVQDTLEAGAGLCDEKVVRMVVEQGPARIDELVRLGVRFNRQGDGTLSLGKEGGHSRRRVAHAFDLTGKEVERALVAAATAEKNIALLENHMCIDILVNVSGGGKRMCAGAQVLSPTGEVTCIRARTVVLCCGGVGKVYLYTSNPDIATGDGIAVAYRGGAMVNNMEFVQFHPTCLYHHQAKNFLISEAVRGEGAVLLNETGERFMEKYEPRQMELATRDKVARAIDTEMKRTGAPCVYLDISHKNERFIRERFPAIYEKCSSLGLDITTTPIPVVPAAHYLCGGVVTDRNGRTTVDNLYALGETACTGLHGANRLASNSLLEALVYSENAFRYLEREVQNIPLPPGGGEVGNACGGEKELDEEILINHNWDLIRRTMWNYVGIVRKRSRLLLAEKRIHEIRDEIDEILGGYRITANMLELKNISLVAELIIKAALERKTSCGLHYVMAEK
jgi:L-aspartate oxidase